MKIVFWAIFLQIVTLDQFLQIDVLNIFFCKLLLQTTFFFWGGGNLSFGKIFCKEANSNLQIVEVNHFCKFCKLYFKSSFLANCVSGYFFANCRAGPFFANCLHFLILSPFSRSPAPRLQWVAQPCTRMGCGWTYIHVKVGQNSQCNLRMKHSLAPFKSIPS